LAEKVLAGEPPDPIIDRARTKALLASGDRKRIAEFSASPDT
jgi:hypothetical protein